MSHAPNVPPTDWFAMTRLDENRAAAQLAQKAGVGVGEVTRMTIWGNHSDTQYPDYKNALIGGRPAPEVITDHAWFTETFIPTVAKRGGAVIKARGASSAASAANAALDSVRSASTPDPRATGSTPGSSPTAAYGIPAGLMYCFPLRTEDGKGRTIVPDLTSTTTPASGSTPPPRNLRASATPSRTCSALRCETATGDREVMLGHRGRREFPQPLRSHRAS